MADLKTDFQNAAKDVMDLAERLYPGQTRVLMGHSLGGAITARFVSALAQPLEDAPWARPVDGLILSAPALEPTMGMLQKTLLPRTLNYW